MIKRTIDISGQDRRVSLKNDQLLIWEGDQLLGKTPSEDLGLLIVDAPATVYTHGALVRIAEQGGMAVLCGANHLPAALLIPADGNSLQARRVRLQMEIKLPLRKRLGRQVIRTK